MRMFKNLRPGEGIVALEDAMREYRNPPKDSVTLLVVFWNPSDFPGRWVLRRHHNMRGGKVLVDGYALLFDMLDDLHEWMDDAVPGLYNFGRLDGDDPAIYEVWM